jgi:hypothetical protein
LGDIHIWLVESVLLNNFCDYLSFRLLCYYIMQCRINSLLFFMLLFYFYFYFFGSHTGTNTFIETLRERIFRPAISTIIPENSK